MSEVSILTEHTCLAMLETERGTIEKQNAECRVVPLFFETVPGGLVGNKEGIGFFNKELSTNTTFQLSFSVPVMLTLRYFPICRYIQGARLFGNSNVNANAAVPIEDDLQISEVAVVKDMNNSTPNSPTLRARFIGQGYKQVCGQADVWGDGVVPEASAHLEGALNVSLDGVYHSPVGSDDVSRPWYGSPAVAEQWVHHLLS
ncbi:hypothetical protein CK203_055908 [Vitis vinifera]|uniref:Uncharacterized protein n=1 Tax=Vitis vinifera TaxID=29760 RepID=A0A438FU19_VITVI|nr:hypothetical protein CK203_055908 [Vitis vinifera]